MAGVRRVGENESITADQILQGAKEALENPRAEKTRYFLKSLGDLLQRLPPREWARVRKYEDFESTTHEYLLVLGLVSGVASFESHQAKKVRFNVYPETENWVQREVEKGSFKTKKDAIDEVMKRFLDELPAQYWKKQEEVTALLKEHALPEDDSKPVSLAVNEISHGILQDVAELMDVPLGDVLATAVKRWEADLESRRETLRPVAEKLKRELRAVSEAVRRMAEISPKDRAGFAVLDWVVEDIQFALDWRLERGAWDLVLEHETNSDPSHMSPGAYVGLAEE